MGGGNRNAGGASSFNNRIDLYFTPCGCYDSSGVIHVVKNLHPAESKEAAPVKADLPVEADVPLKEEDAPAEEDAIECLLYL